MSTGCGKQITTWIPKGFSYKEVKVRCGNTSPDGTPYQCEECEKRNAGRDWRREALEAGEAWDEDGY